MTLHHDGPLDIAIGKRRTDINWRNTPTQWSALAERLQTTTVTYETQAEYAKMKKADQDAIKDVGGFVGGLLSQGRRKAANVAHRQLLTLDIDFGHAGLWDDFVMLYGWAACLYSTHKHTLEAPRLRLLLPIDREVARDEYVAIARKVGAMVGIEYLDHTTYEPHRLMYWPSTSKDGAYLYELQDGPWLPADAILAEYKDWRDSSQWPVSTREHGAVQREIKKQQDPHEKPGIVGAWCRTYGIEEAIDTYLSAVYEPTAQEDRYTFKEGSTAGGLVVYEDKYTFSHHGTDPTSGKLCNAFDLVRLHLFGLKDEDAAEGAPGNKLPSYVAMLDFCTKDPKVRALLVAERLADAREDFAGAAADQPEEPIDDSWTAQLDVDKKGNILSTIDNIMLILNNDQKLKGRLALDLFENREVALRDLPWRKVTPLAKYLTDADDAGLWHYIEKAYGLCNVGKTKAATDLVVRTNAFHPVRDYLTGLPWDGRGRVDSLLIDYMGAEDSAYTRAVTRKALVAAVARVFRPGIKFDYVLVLVGKQGEGKSQIIDRLGRQWFSDSFGTVQGKEAVESIQGVWLVEMGELAGLKKAEVETVKHFISKREDRYRVAYGRRVENFPRQCVFFGTSNNRDFLRDPTGNRRFWPVDTRVTAPARDLFTELGEHEVGQVWAEALRLWQAGEPLYLSRELEEAAQKAQRDHSEEDERTGIVQRYLDRLLPSNWDDMGIYERRAYLADEELTPQGTAHRERVCAAEIWCEALGGKPEQINRFNTKEIHDMMRNMEGWKENKTRMKFKAYGLQTGYVKAGLAVTSNSKNEQFRYHQN